MIPLLEPAAEIYAPVVQGIGWLAGAGVASMLAVVGMVILGSRRRRRRRASVTQLGPRLPEAA